MPARSKAAPKDSSAHPGCEATALRGSASAKSEDIPRSLEGNLWLSADKLRNNMDAAEPSGARQPERGDSPAYFLLRRTGQTAASSPKGERGGVHQFYTSSCVVRLLVTMLAPYKGRIYDPARGSGGIPCPSESRSEAETASRRLPAGREQRGKFIDSHSGQLGDTGIYGQDKRARRQRPSGLVKRDRSVRLRRQQPKQSNATARRLTEYRTALITGATTGKIDVRGVNIPGIPY